MTPPFMQRTGRTTSRLTILSETTLRDSPHGSGIHTMQGGR
jgi:hypothetical protein